MAITNYIETTGSVVRVGVIAAASEEEAVNHAEAEIGAGSAWVDPNGRTEWEVVFDRAYIPPRY